MTQKTKLSDTELKAAQLRRAAGEASLACEGLALSNETRIMFDQFEQQRLPHAACIQIILNHFNKQAQSH